MLKKQFAAELGTAERTIKAQCGSVMRKLGASSVLDVVRLIERLRDSNRCTLKVLFQPMCRSSRIAAKFLIAAKSSEHFMAR